MRARSSVLGHFLYLRNEVSHSKFVICSPLGLQDLLMKKQRLISIMLEWK